MSVSRCIACGGHDWTQLPSWPNGMLSDGGRIAERLAKECCDACGLVRHVKPLENARLKKIFDDDYRLAALPVDDKFVRQRQKLYADWIFSLFHKQKNLSVFDVGAGNGSLLAQLSQAAPHWRVAGIEPVDIAASFGRAAGLDIKTAFLDEFSMSDVNADLVISVNVVEHVADPVGFLKKLADGMADGGRAMIVCPDGERPSTELLIFDHIHSFSSLAMRYLAAEADLGVVAYETAPSAIGPFHAFILAKGQVAENPTQKDCSALTAARLEFLAAWKRLDAVLEMRLRGQPETFAFGYGENAQLLKAYAPASWGHVRRILADAQGMFDGAPVELYHPPREAEKRHLLLAIRPELQGALADRLSRDGNTVVRWDDLVPGDSP